MIVQDDLRFVEEVAPAFAIGTFRQVQLEIVAQHLIGSGTQGQSGIHRRAQIPALGSGRFEFESGVAEDRPEVAGYGGTFLVGQPEIAAGEHARGNHVRTDMAWIGAQPGRTLRVAGIKLPAQCGDRQGSAGPIEAGAEEFGFRWSRCGESIATGTPCREGALGNRGRSDAMLALGQQQDELVHALRVPDRKASCLLRRMRRTPPGSDDVADADYFVVPRSVRCLELEAVAFTLADQRAREWR